MKRSGVARAGKEWGRTQRDRARISQSCVGNCIGYCQLAYLESYSYIAVLYRITSATDYRCFRGCSGPCTRCCAELHRAVSMAKANDMMMVMMFPTISRLRIIVVCAWCENLTVWSSKQQCNLMYKHRLYQCTCVVLVTVHRRAMFFFLGRGISN